MRTLCLVVGLCLFAIGCDSGNTGTTTPAGTGTTATTPDTTTPGTTTTDPTTPTGTDVIEP